MRKILLLLPFLLLAGCMELPDFSFNILNKKYSEELVDHYLDKLNSDFVRSDSLYSESHLLVMKTTIKSEFSGNDVSDSRDFNTLLPYIIHGAMITNGGFSFTQDEHILACSKIVCAGIELCVDYNLTDDDRDISYRHIGKSSVSSVTNSGVEVENLIEAAGVIIECFYTLGINLDVNDLLFITSFNVFTNSLGDLNRIEVLNSIYDYFLAGRIAQETDSLQKYVVTKNLITTFINYYTDLDSEDKIAPLDKIDLTSEIINSSIYRSEEIENLGVNSASIQEELISLGVTALLEYDSTLTIGDIAESLAFKDSIDMTKEDIELLIN